MSGATLILSAVLMSAPVVGEAHASDPEPTYVYVKDPRPARFGRRMLAMLPFGVGHFVAGRRGLGATFAATEGAVAITGLTLMGMRRWHYNCIRDRRTRMLTCAPDVDPFSDPYEVRREIGTARRVEAAMGWTFIGTAALDVVLGQILLNRPRRVRPTAWVSPDGSAGFRFVF